MKFSLMYRLPHDWMGIYAHRDAEAALDTINTDSDWCAPDLISSDTPLDCVSDGMHDCDLLGNPATLAVWTARDGRRRGYVVLKRDTRAMADAIKGLHDRPAVI